ncbi:MAG TPA: putative metal-dependent hydrolase [Vicinamibacterales bacterium]|nr:putative metal-dependent hydrolase [Vicinamibacterales bacterium]
MDPRYPIGRFDPADQTPLEQVIDVIAALPARLLEVASELTESHLATPYREGGWTARQVFHHLADSHLNSFVRFRLALTEDRPTIKPYDEKLWAQLPDAAEGPIGPSLELIEGLHARWVALMRAMTPSDFQRTFVHPDRGEMSLELTARLYGWHCRHHLGHLEIVAALPGGRSG